MADITSVLTTSVVFAVTVKKILRNMGESGMMSAEKVKKSS